MRTQSSPSPQPSPAQSSRKRRVEELFARYGEFHRHPSNKAIHWVCVPLIVWSVLGLLWAWSPIAALIAIACSMVFYLWLSPPLALGMLGVTVLMLFPLRLLGDHLLSVSVAVFVVAWSGQFIGHRIEGRKPAFADDIKSFLVAPAWLLGFLYARAGIRY